MKAQLKRELGLFGAVVVGLGSILGTGVFVSLGLAAAEAGWGLLAAIALAALVAAANGLSSAQLAAAHPVSGGTYEYSQRFLGPLPGFLAGWLFLTAKSASAATAALGTSAYLWYFTGNGSQHNGWFAPLIALLLTLVVLGGMRRTQWLNIAVVLLTLLALCALIVAGIAALDVHPLDIVESTPPDPSLAGVLAAAALVFVAFTGYGRIATMAEEVRNPAQTIPRAVIVTCIVTALLYLGVGAVALNYFGPAGYAMASLSNAAPLGAVAYWTGGPWLSLLVGIGALTAMLGVLLNLILGLSRVVLAMARRRDLPAGLAAIGSHDSPNRAVLLTGVVILLLTLLGSVKAAWSVSAFTVLVYYAITNLCALRLPPRQRRYPAWVAWFGLGGCLGLAAFIEWPYIAGGLAFLALLVAVFELQQRFQTRSQT